MTDVKALTGRWEEGRISALLRVKERLMQELVGLSQDDRICGLEEAIEIVEAMLKEEEG